MFDLDQVTGNLTVRHATGTETYATFAGGTLQIQPRVEPVASRALSRFVDPRIGVDAGRRERGAPLIVILALACSQPTSQGVRSTGGYFRSCPRSGRTT